jgi:hypothetical protein
MRSPSAGHDRDDVDDLGAPGGLGTHIGPGADFRIVRRGATWRRASGNEEIRSMDRLRRVLAGGTLAVMLGTVVAASGCRSMRNEVPPGPKFSGAGEPSPNMFNSAPHPYNSVGGNPYGNATTPGQPGMSGLGSQATGSANDGLPSGLGAGGGTSSLGTPAPNMPGMGQPTSNAFGPPGTSGAYGPGR